jgi:exodeoxyribonuclease V gamma subunit
VQVHRSDKLETLVEALARSVAEPLSSPFVPETIVVPSRALGVWLSLRLAELHDVWANPRFVTVETFLDDLHADESSTDDRFSCHGLTWSIAAALPSLLTAPAFASVRAYLEDDHDTTKRVALARKLATTFHRYLTHRPERLAAWERNGEDSKDPTEAWEAALWRAVVAEHGTDHRARRHATLLESIRASKPANTPERLSVFIPESLSDTAIEVFHALSRHIDVRVFLRTAADHVLADSLGARERDLAAALGERDNVTFHDEPSSPSTPSIAVHACHGPMRECEVLRDQLLAALTADRTLEARDILVLCPDLERYAPVIDAVFGTSERVKGFLPYRIVDRSARRGLAVVEAFLALLDLAPSRATATDVVDFLAREPVRTRFALDENEMDVVRQWVTESGIRWGEDETHRRDVGQPAYRANTWRFGLDRLVLGYAMGSEDHAMCEGCLPYDDVEGTTSGTLGGFATFCEELFNLRKMLVGLAPLAAWRDRLTVALPRLFSASWQTELQHQMIREALDELVACAGAAGFTDEVPLAVIRDALADDLDARASALESSPGGITFAAFRSSRCVPARVLVMLGMNDGTFPRASRGDAFDLVAMKPRRGDPSPRDADRQAFLDALLCARDLLLVTYIGQSIANNAERPPSVVVSELLDSLGEKAGSVILRHALHAFSPVYFGDSADPRLFSHAAALCDGARSMRARRVDFPPFVVRPLPAPKTARAVTLDALARFFEHPLRAFVQTRLGVYLGRDVAPLDDREPLELDALDRWKLGAPLLERARDGEKLRGVPPDVLAEGILPLGVVGSFAYDEVLPGVLAVADALKPLLDLTPPPPREIDLEVDGTRIVGWLRNAGTKAHVVYMYSQASGKYRISTWIRHLAMQCSELHHESWLVARAKLGATRHRYQALSTTDARALLASLVDLYWRGQEAPLLFFQDASIAYAECLPEKGAAAALAKATKAFHGDFGSANDAYVRKVLGEREPFDTSFEPFEEPRDRARFPAFADLAVAICGPLVQHEEVQK